MCVYLQCHLATLLKTAEELRIKGLAEVSWREEEPVPEQTVNGVHSAMPQVSTMLDSSGEPPNKRKRGRPPIDDYDQQFSNPKITNVAGNVQTDDNFSANDVTNSDADASAWEDEQNADNTDTEQKFQPEPVSECTFNAIKKNTDIIYVLQEEYPPEENMTSDQAGPGSASGSENGKTGGGTSTQTPKSTPSTPNTTTSTQSASALEANWPDVIKMNDYLNTGRRQQFWEEPFTKRVMDAIKNKDLEMKSAAELLGVSYGTLYGRYRDAYGCLKHPYRVRDFWTESGPADILSKLQRKEITLFRAAEQLNVTPQTLSNYLLSLHQGSDSGEPGGQLGQYDGYEEIESDNDNSDSILPDLPAKPTSSRNSITSGMLLDSSLDV